MPIRTPLRSWRNLLLVALVAALCFGGSFTCKGSTHDNKGSSATVDIR